LRDFCTVRGLAISWLIVGILAFTLFIRAKPASVSQIPVRGYPPPPGRSAHAIAQSEIAPTAHR
jgi:hypothetical protein